MGINQQWEDMRELLRGLVNRLGEHAGDTVQITREAHSYVIPDYPLIQTAKGSIEVKFRVEIEPTIPQGATPIAVDSTES